MSPAPSLRVTISPALLEALRERRERDQARRGSDPIEAEHDAFFLSIDLFVSSYLTADGRVLVIGDVDDESLHEGKEDQAIASIVACAKTSDIEGLLAVLPPCPPDGDVCPLCAGARWAEPMPGFGHILICFMCWGRGWVVQRLRDEAAARGLWPRPPT